MVELVDRVPAIYFYANKNENKIVREIGGLENLRNQRMGELVYPLSWVYTKHPIVYGNKELIVISRIDPMDHLIDLFENKNYEKVTIPTMDADEDSVFPQFREPCDEENHAYNENVDENEFDPKRDTGTKEDVEECQEQEEHCAYQIHRRE